MTAAGARVRTRARIEGTVQGVGFRPFVYRLAIEEGLAGYVLNDERGVLLEVEGHQAAVARFMRRLTDEAPPLAVIDSIADEALEPARPARVPDPRERAIRARRRAGHARFGDLPRLPGRAVLAGGPPLPLPVHQLHELRSAVHDRPRRPL